MPCVRFADCRLGLNATLLSSALLAPLAQAVPVALWSKADTQAYTTLNTLDTVGVLATNTVITNQFQAQGFTGTGVLRSNGCGANAWTSYGMTGNSFNTYGPGCQTNNAPDSFSLRFNQDLSALAFDAYHYTANIADKFELLNDGVVVATLWSNAFTFDDMAGSYSQYGGNRYYQNDGYSRAGVLTLNGNGSVFDELRFTEGSVTSDQYLVFDNLRYNTASVPEPVTLGLVAAALAGAGVATRYRRKPSPQRAA